LKSQNQHQRIKSCPKSKDKKGVIISHSFQNQLKALLTDIIVHSNLPDKLNAANSLDEVVATAKEHGLDFGNKHMSLLSDEDLKGVAGGTISAQQTYCA
jgi:predicted ribosomally synthesized peptide with nif11-like leader